MTRVTVQDGGETVRVTVTDPSAPLFRTVSWTGDTLVEGRTLVRLPTGGMGYRTSDYTTRPTWDATERAAWTFIPGGHHETITSSTTWVVPTGIIRGRVRCIGGGPGSNGGGSATTSGGVANQVGGASSGPALVVEADITFAASTCTATIGAAGVKGTGGAANNHPGGFGTPGGDTGFTDGTTQLWAPGGGVGTQSLGNSTAEVFGGGAGASWDTSGVAAAPIVGIPGYGGGCKSTVAGYPLATNALVFGGGGGGPAAAGKGGGGGPAVTSRGFGCANGSTGSSSTADGGNGADAVFPGDAGGGGGAGAPGGKGGDGGNGAPGLIELWF